MKNNNYIRHIPYLRNSIAYYHNFRHTFVKWWYLQIFLSFFRNFHLKGQKIAQNKNNNYICHVQWFRNSIPYDHNFWSTCGKWWHLQTVFPFSWNFHFRAVMGIKGQKTVQMKNNNYIGHVPYLRNSIAYDHHFWCTCVKW